MIAKKALELLNDVEFSEKYQGIQEYTEMLIVCKEALGKQIPRKPYFGEALGYKGFNGYLCPICRNWLLYPDEIPNSRDSFCSFCGQKLDWEDAIKEAPAVDAQEIKHGKWIKMYNNPDDGNYYCSECHNGIDVATGKVTPIDRGLFYCPNCGAKMDGGKNNA